MICQHLGGNPLIELNPELTALLCTTPTPLEVLSHTPGKMKSEHAVHVCFAFILNSQQMTLQQLGSVDICGSQYN